MENTFHTKKRIISLKKTKNHKLLPSQVAQQTMIVIDRNMKSFFRLLKEKQKGNYNRSISLSKYLPKDGFFVCIFPSQID